MRKDLGDVLGAVPTTHDQVYPRYQSVISAGVKLCTRCPILLPVPHPPPTFLLPPSPWDKPGFEPSSRHHEDYVPIVQQSNQMK